jgi:shikimate kinase
MFSQRVPLYEKYADITVDCEDEDFEEVMGKVIGELKEEGGF